MLDVIEEVVARSVRGEGLVVALTGAGISAESGIPTFRGGEGYWTVGAKEYRPQELATWRAFERMPEDVWRWYLYRRSVCRAAPANPAHHALQRLDLQLGDRFLLITQNVDGLHSRAGHSPHRLYEIHGNLDYMRCARACNPGRFPVPPSIPGKSKGDPLLPEERDLLRCPKCGGLARPHVLWFDECYDEPLYRFESSLQAAARATLLIIIGTSGATNLPEQVAMTAAKNGATILEVNITGSALSDLALRHGMHIREKASIAVPRVVDAILNEAGRFAAAPVKQKGPSGEVPSWYLADREGIVICGLRLVGRRICLGTEKLHDPRIDGRRVAHFLEHLNSRRESEFWRSQPTTAFLTYIENTMGNFYSDVQLRSGDLPHHRPANRHYGEGVDENGSDAWFFEEVFGPDWEEKALAECRDKQLRMDLDRLLERPCEEREWPRNGGNEVRRDEE